MAPTLKPFTRVILFLSELNENKIEDLANPQKCDLLRHTTKLSEEMTTPAETELAGLMVAQGNTLLSLVRDGEFARAQTEREELISTCKKLKDLL